MGSTYSRFITKEILEVPPEFPHFKKENVITIPINADGDDVAAFLKVFSAGEIKIPPHFCRTEEDAAQYNGGEKVEWLNGDPEIILAELKKFDLVTKEFILLYTSDWADIPVDWFSAAFKNGHRVEGTYTSSDDGISGNALAYLGISSYDLNDFRDYWDAASQYEEQL
ncbi:hypothetical protein IDJ77_19005 [Mucilaginibacter sp. ZT4R22]|uniref:YubB ferredoxin-like domain-containing protein n=1 Tax=Mucilaginibacter pankratovii TaxID=2772110 RepID=A0ABR7WUB8_9SPHI|nr:hypothetical protein [Mucilaginibacter pankratovii]MBD1365911.1 hypothetical protein [Mucilaginibacter pankratovii]